MGFWGVDKARAVSEMMYLNGLTSAAEADFFLAAIPQA
jgi:hypothetical protein